MELLVALIFIVLGSIGLLAQHLDRKSKAETERRIRVERQNALTQRYANSPFRDDILSGTVRVGMSAQELIDAWGKPAAIDERVLKTKVVHTYKYAQTGARSFRQRVKVENGIVVGWSQN